MKKAWTILAGLLALAGCSGAGGGAPESMESTESQYMEIRFEGRIYVMGSEKMTNKYHAHLPYTKTYLGLGPNGETVILENEKKGSDLKQRLLGQYCAEFGLSKMACADAPAAGEGPFLTLHTEGRIFVIGSDKYISKYKPHLPYTKTYLGMGPKGETVILENEKKGETLKKVLLGQFCQTHQITSGACAM